MRLVPITMLALVGCIPARAVPKAADAPIGRVAPPPPPTIVVPDVEEERVFDDDAMVPCTAQTELDAAEHALSAMSARIRALDDGPGPKVTAVTAELTELLSTQCFELAGADLADPLEFDSGLALKEWWDEGGGYAGIGAYIRGKMLEVVAPGQPRASLLLDGHENHPLAPILCRADDANCGRETAGWWRRAERLLSRRDPMDSPDQDTCADDARETDPNARWDSYHSCEVGRAPRFPALPLGRFKSPADGLFATLENACTLTIYDLATGTRVRADACYRGNGQLRTSVGRVPLASIREAAWLALLSGAAHDNVRRRTTLPVPQEIVPGRERGLGSISLGGYGSFGGGRRVAWTWLRRNKSGAYVGQASGDVWRTPARAVSSEIAELFEIADDHFADGCAPPYPRQALGAIAWDHVGPNVYPGGPDVGPTFGEATIAPLKLAVITAKSPTHCTASP